MFFPKAAATVRRDAFIVSIIVQFIDLQKEENMFFRDEIVCLFTDLVYLDCMFEGFPEFITLQLSQKRSPPII